MSSFDLIDWIARLFARFISDTMSRSMKVAKCPEVHSRSNRAVVNPADFNLEAGGVSQFWDAKHL